MSNALPYQVDLRYCEQNRRLAGEFGLEKMTRLADFVQSLEGSARVDLQFGVDTGISNKAVKSVKGFVEAELQLTCQRCLEPVTLPIRKEVHIGLCESEFEMEDLPDHFDPLLVEDGRFSLFDLVEDELILALPLIPKHTLAECEARGYVTRDAESAATKGADGTGAENESNETKRNPFSALKDFKPN